MVYGAQHGLNCRKADASDRVCKRVSNRCERVESRVSKHRCIGRQCAISGKAETTDPKHISRLSYEDVEEVEI